MEHWTKSASKMSDRFKARRAKYEEERSQKLDSKSKKGAPPLSRYRFWIFMAWASLFGLLTGIFIHSFWLFILVLVPALCVAGFMGYVSEAEERRAIKAEEELAVSQKLVAAVEKVWGERRLEADELRSRLEEVELQRDDAENEIAGLGPKALTNADRRMIRYCAESIEMDFQGFSRGLRELADRSENGDS